MTSPDPSLIDRLAATEVQLAAWQAEINRAFKEHIDVEKVFNEGSGARFESGILTADAAARHKVGTEPEEASFLLLDAFCTRYLDAPDTERTAMRAAMAGARTTRRHLSWYLARCRHQLELTRDRQWLRLALAAASLSELFPDYRDLYLSLGALYVSAVGVGVEPGSAFREAGELSNRDVNAFLRTSTHDFLANFERSAYFDSIHAEVAEARASAGARASARDEATAKPAASTRDEATAKPAASTRAGAGAKAGNGSE